MLHFVDGMDGNTDEEEEEDTDVEGEEPDANPDSVVAARNEIQQI
jgi:hypothetical protein